MIDPSNTDQGDEGTMTMTDKDQAPAAHEEPTAALEVVSAPAASAQPHRDAAIEMAAEAALAMPGVPGRDEFLTLAMTAKMLSLSGAAPEAVRESPYVAFHVAMVGRDLGISPSAAINLIDVIKGQGGYQLSLSPQLLNGQIKRLGLGSIRPKESTAERCVAVAHGPAGEVLGEYEFTWEDARMAGLVGDECEGPGNHSPKCDNKSSDYRFKCNQGYKTYPKRMMWWRASGYAAADFFPEAGLGLYTPEELGAVVDETGRAIDPMSVELPDGYTDPRAIEQAKRDAADPRQDAGDLYRLWLRMRALPEEERGDVVAKWKQLEKLAGVGVYRLTESQYRLAQSTVAGLEKKAKSRVGYVIADAVLAEERLVAAHVVDLLSPPWAQGAPEPTDPTEGADGEPEAQDGPETAATEDASATPEATDEEVANEAGAALVDATVALVTKMKPDAVRAKLEELGRSADGDNSEIRKRLVVALLREHINAKRAEAGDTATDER